MNDDELRERLGRLDPQATAPVEPLTSDLLERLMTATATPPVAPADRRTRRGLALASAAAAVVAVAATAGVLATRGADDPASAKPTTLALTLPGGAAGPTMSSCIMFSVDVLKDMPVAFAGTATAVDADSITLDVTKWYKGGTADEVTLANPGGNVAVALDGVEFTEGKDYLVAANAGQVNGCGYSGEATPDLAKAYADAFGS